MTESHLTVSEVARLAHVSVRTLHHYDDIGLLSPAHRSAAGYRLYAEPDLRRLHEILLFRELGLPLAEIQRIMDADAAGRAAALRSHRSALDDRLRRTEAVIRAVDATLDALEKGTEMQNFEGYENFDHAQYAAEAEQRWGDTEAYRESARRTKQYRAEDWAAIRAENDALMEELLALHRSGAEPGSESAMSVAERHRLHIDRWFYPCSHAFHAGLADMYTADPRFTEHFEKRGEGLSRFMAEAIRANAARA